MTYDYDDQLIEATGVRRGRLAQALLFGPARLRRQWTDRVGTHLAGAFLTVLLCAGCVAVSFVIQLFADDPALQRSAPGPGATSATGAPAWLGDAR